MCGRWELAENGKGAKKGSEESQAADKIYMKGNPFNLITISKL